MRTPGTHLLEDTLRTLRVHGSRKNVQGMARYGIVTKKMLGVSAPTIKSIARNIGRNHQLAMQLWKTGILEARGIASLIGEPAKVTRKLAESWVKDFDNWAVCDTVCGNLFDKTPFAFDLAVRWTKRTEEFVCRAGFVMMAELAVHNKLAADENYLKFLPVIVKGSTDERNFVKKAVNWALRQIGKRNSRLNIAAIQTARKIHRLQSSSAKWIASDALRELQSAAVQRRVRSKR